MAHTHIVVGQFPSHTEAERVALELFLTFCVVVNQFKQEIEQQFLILILGEECSLDSGKAFLNTKRSIKNSN